MKYYIEVITSGKNAKGKWVADRVRRFCNGMLLNGEEYGLFMAMLRASVDMGDKKFPKSLYSELTEYDSPSGDGVRHVEYKARRVVEYSDFHVVLKPTAEIHLPLEDKEL